MAEIEQAARAELSALPTSQRSSALAATVLDLARRLDADPADTAAVLLARELRFAMAELRRQAGGDTTGDVEAFLARIAAPDGGHPAH
jgi:hypothetical protein